MKRAIAKIVNGLGGMIEASLLPLLDLPPAETVWIIGPPRSGTTLLYQVLTRHFRVAYFPNFLAAFYRAPLLAYWLGQRVYRRDDRLEGYESDFGQTRSRWGPHEAGQFWYRWLPGGDAVYVPARSIPPRRLKRMGREVSALAKIARAPVVIKNTYHSLRLAPISEAFPEACFLVCDRDPTDTAQSILKGRIQRNGNKTAWWSAPPKEIAAIKTHPYWEQVAEQVFYIYRQIEEDKRTLGAQRFFAVSYEGLCREPAAMLARVERFWEGRGLRLERRSIPLPDQFPFSSGRQVEEEDYRLIRGKVEQLWR